MFLTQKSTTEKRVLNIYQGIRHANRLFLTRQSMTSKIRRENTPEIHWKFSARKYARKNLANLGT